MEKAHVYAQIRFYADDGCFIRTTQAPVDAGPVEALRWLEPMLAARAQSVLRLNNHLRYFHTHFARTELEYKYNLAAGTDIWAVSMELLRALRHGALADCRPEYREEFQIHYFDNHMFDVTGPDHERGYASFIPTVNGKHVMKRKWFTDDTFARREQLFSDLEVLPEDFGDYLRTGLGLQVQALPPSGASATTSSASRCAPDTCTASSSITCSLLAAPDVVLSQCEMEYRRSRCLLDHDDDEVLQEMGRIDHWLLSYEPFPPVDAAGGHSRRPPWREPWPRARFRASSKCRSLRASSSTRRRRFTLKFFRILRRQEIKTANSGAFIRSATSETRAKLM